MKHGALYWYEPGDLDDEQRLTYEAIVGGPRATTATAAPVVDDRGRLHGPFNAMLVNPRLGMALQAVGASLRFETSLDDRLRELAVLTVARAQGSQYEWHVHERLGRAAGLTDDELATMAAGGEPVSLSPREQLARALVIELVERHEIDEALLGSALDTFGEVALVELVVLAGYYQLLATGMHVLRTPLPDGASPPLA